MNERIKQITGQVLDELVPETWVALGYDKIKEIQNRTAELIVRECMEQVWYTREDGINGNVSQVIKDRIKEHFGVGE
jgi:hypothetical protein